MRAPDPMWQAWTHAGPGGRITMIVIISLAAGQAYGILLDTRQWLADRFEMTVPARIWQARVCRRVFRPGRRVTCPDGAAGVLEQLWDGICGDAGCCPPVGLVTFDPDGVPPRIVPLADLTAQMPNPRTAPAIAAIAAVMLGVPVAAGVITSVLVPWRSQTVPGLGAAFGAALITLAAVVLTCRRMGVGGRLHDWIAAGEPNGPADRTGWWSR